MTAKEAAWKVVNENRELFASMTKEFAVEIIEQALLSFAQEKMEEEFRTQGCEGIRVGCFAPNTDTHAFYEKCGYVDRYIEMLKKL